MTRPQDGPNTLVACVSAVAGFARCLAMHQVADSKEALEEVYPEYRDLGATDLITGYLSRIGQAPHTIFGNGAWSDFGYAVKYRNILAHEATYLGQDIFPRLINAARWSLRNWQNWLVSQMQPNKALQTDKVKLSRLLHSQEPGQLAFAAELGC